MALSEAHKRNERFFLLDPCGHKTAFRPKRAYDYVGLLYSFVVLLHDICVLPDPM